MSSGTLDSARPPVLLKWKDYRRNLAWDPSSTDSWGSHRATYPKIEADYLTGQMVLLPSAQGIAPESKTDAAIFVGAKGTVEVTVDNRTFLIGPRDVLAIPAETAYQYANVDLDAALLFTLIAKGRPDGLADTVDVASRVEDWPESSRTPIYMPWQEVRCHFTWHLPRAEKWGWHRGSGPHFFCGPIRGHLVRQPSAQSCPWHAPTRDLIFLQLDGEVEFNAAGRRWHLEPLDLLMMPANTPYVYTNIGLIESLFCDTGGRAPAGTASVYYESDPGWPVDPAAEILETVSGHEGEPRAASRKEK